MDIHYVGFLVMLLQLLRKEKLIYIHILIYQHTHTHTLTSIDRNTSFLLYLSFI